MPSAGSTVISLRVRYFAQARALAGSKEDRIELPSPAHVEELVAKVLEARPQLKEMRQILRVMVNGRMIDGNIELHEGDSLVLLPPTAGG